jgi:hypothetical protein
MQKANKNNCIDLFILRLFVLSKDNVFLVK